MSYIAFKPSSVKILVIIYLKNSYFIGHIYRNSSGRETDWIIPRKTWNLESLQWLSNRYFSVRNLMHKIGLFVSHYKLLHGMNDVKIFFVS
jgi:hypothetical protein